MLTSLAGGITERYRERMRRNLGGLTAVAAILACLLPGSATAAQNAQRSLSDPGCCTLYGSKAAISMDAASGLGTYVQARVYAATTAGASAHAGVMRTSGSGAYDSCPASATFAYVALYYPSVGTDFCDNVLSVLLGDRDTYAVLRGADTNRWGLWVDGTRIRYLGMGAPSASTIHAGVYADAALNVFEAEYGAGGVTWQRATCVGGCWTTIASSSVYTGGGLFSVGSLPSPFSITKP